MPQGMAPHPCACGWHRLNSIDHNRTILKIGQAVEKAGVSYRGSTEGLGGDSEGWI